MHRIFIERVLRCVKTKQTNKQKKEYLWNISLVEGATFPVFDFVVLQVIRIRPHVFVSNAFRIRKPGNVICNQ